MLKEARARIKINKLLEAAGWRFFDDANGRANIVLEPGVKLTQQAVDVFGDDFEKTTNGFIDFLLLDEKGFPLVVLEAKSEDKSPLDGKEQARGYAQSQGVKFIILSNGNTHYLWNLESGSPEMVSSIPRPEDFKDLSTFKSDPARLAIEVIGRDYVVLTQLPTYAADPLWLSEKTREDFIKDKGLKFLRPYQIRAIGALQEAGKDGRQRYLFEMATGTGKTLISAAVIKLFLKTGNAKRVLFLVDRLELEDQAQKNFVRYLKNDFTSVVYKENREEWRQGEIVVSTVQTLARNNHFRKAFTPTDFDLLISDEAHRSISGDSRAVFDYFAGYKLGLTATPKDYLKKIDSAKLSEKDPRELERRQLLDTYGTFGCASGTPTYRYSLSDGVSEGYLVHPTVVDARTEVSTKLLSEQGYVFSAEDEDGNTEEKTFGRRDFEKSFYSDDTNRVFCKTFLDNALRDPLSGEIGKTIVFCISQAHASKITQLLNEMADQMFPGKYQSDFAVQITSNIGSAQQFTIRFANNNLNQHTLFLDGYQTSKTRVCVTVSMMTTGYDCEDILNVCLMRPIFSPTEFIQIKGRGTRKHTFVHKMKVDGELEEVRSEKQTFKLFDFFATCEFFEEKYDYDQVLTLPRRSGGSRGESIPSTPSNSIKEASIGTPDALMSYTEKAVGLPGMRIDRELFQAFGETVKSNAFLQEKYDAGDLAAVEEYVTTELLNNPDGPYTLETLRKAVKADRSISLREMIRNIFGEMPTFKSKDELLEEEFTRFVAIHQPDGSKIPAIKNFFKAYTTDAEIRDIVDRKQFVRLATNAKLTMDDIRVIKEWWPIVVQYIRDTVDLSAFE